MKPSVFKLSIWGVCSLTWHETKPVYQSEQEAQDAAKACAPGRFRISEVSEEGRFDLLPFEITQAPAY